MDFLRLMLNTPILMMQPVDHPDLIGLPEDVRDPLAPSPKIVIEMPVVYLAKLDAPILRVVDRFQFECFSETALLQ